MWFGFFSFTLKLGVTYLLSQQSEVEAKGIVGFLSQQSIVSSNSRNKTQVWWSPPVIPTLGRWKQQDLHELQARPTTEQDSTEEDAKQ